LNTIFTAVFITSGVFSVLTSIDSKIKQFVLAFYNTLAEKSFTLESSSIFFNKSLNSDDTFIRKAMFNFSNNFYSMLNVSNVLFLDNLTLRQFIAGNSNSSFISLFNKFLIDIS